jgi:hypothetical protein
MYHKINIYSHVQSCLINFSLSFDHSCFPSLPSMPPPPPPGVPFSTINILSADHSDPALWGNNCLPPLERWDSRFDSHSGHEYMGVFSVCVSCVGSELAKGWSPCEESYHVSVRQTVSDLVWMATGLRTESVKWTRRTFGQEPNYYEAIHLPCR